MAFQHHLSTAAEDCIRLIQIAATGITTLPPAWRTALSSSSAAVPGDATLSDALRQTDRLLRELQSDAAQIIHAVPSMRAWLMLYAGVSVACHRADPDRVWTPMEVAAVEFLHNLNGDVGEATVAQDLTLYRLGLTLPTLASDGSLDATASVDAEIGLNQLSRWLTVVAENNSARRAADRAAVMAHHECKADIAAAAAASADRLRIRLAARREATTMVRAARAAAWTPRGWSTRVDALDHETPAELRVLGLTALRRFTVDMSDTGATEGVTTAKSDATSGPAPITAKTASVVAPILWRSTADILRLFFHAGADDRLQVNPAAVARDVESARDALEHLCQTGWNRQPPDTAMYRLQQQLRCAVYAVDSGATADYSC